MFKKLLDQNKCKPSEWTLELNMILTVVFILHDNYEQ